jgi:hypothetical protein
MTHDGKSAACEDFDETLRVIPAMSPEANTTAMIVFDMLILPYL